MKIYAFAKAHLLKMGIKLCKRNINPAKTLCEQALCKSVLVSVQLPIYHRTKKTNIVSVGQNQIVVLRSREGTGRRKKKIIMS